MMADAIGLLVLAGEMALILRFFPIAGTPYQVWIVTYLILAVITVFLWRSEKSPRSSRGWLQLVAGSFIFGTFFFGVDMLIGHFSRPNLPLFDAAKQAGGPFGFGATLLVCPGFTIIAIAGFARALYSRKHRKLATN